MAIMRKVELPFFRPLNYLAVLASVAIVAIASANDGWWSATSNAESFGKRHPTIQMVTEDLLIDYSDDKVYVTVDYLFRNHGKATQVTMAFPEAYANTDKGYSWIRSWVDGKPAKLTRKVIKKDEDGGSAVHTKTVRFGAKQTRRVKVRYVTHLSGNTSGELGLTYYLFSGASWYKPIDRCSITIDWSKAKKVSPPEIELSNANPQWKAVTRTKRRAVLTNFVPKSNLQLSMVDWFWSFQINGRRVPFAVAGYNPRPTTGSPSDPLMSVESIDSFLSSSTVKAKDAGAWQNWEDKIMAPNGASYVIQDGQLVSEKGKGIKLARKPRKLNPMNYGEAQDYVFLRDVVTAMGGKCRYEGGIFKIELPRR